MQNNGSVHQMPSNNGQPPLPPDQEISPQQQRIAFLQDRLNQAYTALKEVCAETLGLEVKLTDKKSQQRIIISTIQDFESELQAYGQMQQQTQQVAQMEVLK